MNMSLIEYIKNHWDKSSFMKLSLNESIRSQIENETLFMNSYYYSIPLRTRAYVIINQITENSLPKCKCGCGNVCAIDKTYTEKGFRLYSNSNCSRKIKQFQKSLKNNWRIMIGFMIKNYSTKINRIDCSRIKYIHHSCCKIFKET